MPFGGRRNSVLSEMGDAPLPGYAADLMIFDSTTIGPGTKRRVADFPGGQERFSARPRGFVATIVNGEPIVLDGKLTGALPGQVVRPFRRGEA